MKYKAFLFDLDGVIVDTARFHYLAWKELAQALSIPFSEDDNERLKGVDRMASLAIILDLGKKRLSYEEQALLATEKNKRFLQYVHTMTALDILPGVLSFLRELKEHKMRMAVASSSKNARTILSKVGLESFFDCIIDGNQVKLAKPDPEIFLKAAQQLGIAPHECVVFEDARAGVDAAHKGGMAVVGIGKESLLGGANWVVPDFKEMTLKKLLEHV